MGTGDDIRASALHHRVLGSIADGVTVQDASGRIIYANDAAARIVGCDSAEEMVATPPSELLARFEITDEAGNVLPPNLLPGRMILQGADPPEILVRYRQRETGAERWSLLAATPLVAPDGTIEGAINSFRDVTQEILARRRAEAAESALQFLSAASQELASSLDYETTLTSVAKLAVPRLADWCAVDLLDDSGSLRRLVVAHVDPAKVAVAQDLARRYPIELRPPRALTEGEPELYSEITDELLQSMVSDPGLLGVLRQLGLKSAMAVPLVARGRTLGVLTFISAESGRKYGPSDLALAADLGNRAALAVDNARLHREVQRAVETRDEFLAAASHDLKNPLTAIKAAAQLARMQLARESPRALSRVASALDTIEGSASRMASLADEFLDVARLQLGQPLDLDRERTDLVRLVRTVADDLARTAQKHRISVEAEDELIGDWDVARLQRVLTNLLENAIKYSPNGGEVTVTVEREEGEVPFARFTVRDHGVGIPETDLPRVFERFRRGSNVVGRIGGTGIGLAGARQIVEQHGGAMTIESREHEGTAVRVRLPMIADEPRSGALSLSEGPSAGYPPP
ncbi:MAG TPA: ATP-binding protein [Chloroflexota bacterium]|nr:ATP-binding protein [Chloroflexota bacterium]